MRKIVILSVVLSVVFWTTSVVAQMGNNELNERTNHITGIMTDYFSHHYSGLSLSSQIKLANIYRNSSFRNNIMRPKIYNLLMSIPYHELQNPSDESIRKFARCMVEIGHILNNQFIMSLDVTGDEIIEVQVYNRMNPM